MCTKWVLRMIRFNVGITNLYIRNEVELSWTNESQKTNGQRVKYKSSYTLTGVCFFSCILLGKIDPKGGRFEQILVYHLN